MGAHFDRGGGLEPHDVVGSAELKVAESLARVQCRANFGGHDNRRNLCHSDRQNRNQADRRVQHEQPARLGELVPGSVFGMKPRLPWNDCSDAAASDSALSRKRPHALA